jgi:hypothetical protein
MSTFFLIVSVWLLEATFGIRMRRDGEIEFDKPRLLEGRRMVVVQYTSALVLAIIPLAILLQVHWAIILFLNPFFLFMAGPVLTKAYLVRFAWGRGPSWDMLYCFAGGIITLMIGLIIRYYEVLSPWLIELINRFI